jgi:hypothetical protein
MGDMIQLMFGMMRSMDRRSKEGGTRVKLDALEMPKFTGRVGEDLYRFVDQLSHFLCNYVDPTEWVARLKNAVLRDQRAFDSVVETERTAAHILQTQVDPTTGEVMSPTREQWGRYYGVITEKLMVDRGMTWEERLRLLIIEFSAMVQSRHEWVAEYAHRFRENDHMLCKFIPNAHRHWVVDQRYPEGGYYDDLELRTKFMMGLRTEVSRELLSRVDQYPTLDHVAEASSRFETQFPPPQSQ